VLHDFLNCCSKINTKNYTAIDEGTILVKFNPDFADRIMMKGKKTIKPKG
jgi:hypothetical protein